MQGPPSNSLLGLDLAELTNLALGSGQPAYRGQQLFDAVYRQKIERVDQVSTLPLEYRARLAEEGWRVGLPALSRKFASSDGTVRYLVELADGETVETVWMPEGDGGESGDGSEAGDEFDAGSASERVVAGLRPAGRGPATPLRAGSVPSPHMSGHRATICVSSQVGCAVNCKFCFTALLGVKRNLEAGEIVRQIGAVQRGDAADPKGEAAAGEEGCEGVPAAAAGAAHVRVCAVGGCKRCSRAGARSSGVGARHQGKN